MATAVLICCFVLMVFAKWLETQFPYLSFVAAFAEAATIGGIADWYAVVALFKHPMNIPIPHTAIIPNNKDRIADNLAGFIEKNFLAEAAITEKLRQVNFASQVSNWLSDPERSRTLAGFVSRFAPHVFSSLEGSGIRRFAAKQFSNQIEKTDIAPLLTSALDSVVQHGQHQKLVNDLLAALHRFLNDETAIEAINTKIKEELPTLFKVVGVDAILLRRIVSGSNALLDEIKDDPNHQVRQEFEKFLKNYVNRLRRSKRFANRVEAIKSELLQRPELSDAADGVWESLKRFVEEDAVSEESQLAERLGSILVEFGHQLGEDEALLAEVNEGIVTAITSFVLNQRSEIAGFISDQVKGWDLAQLTLLIEANIGKDLQYIRFNGMLIGGIVGILLHSVERLISGH